MCALHHAGRESSHPFNLDKMSFDCIARSLQYVTGSPYPTTGRASDRKVERGPWVPRAGPVTCDLMAESLMSSAPPMSSVSNRHIVSIHGEHVSNPLEAHSLKLRVTNGFIFPWDISQINLSEFVNRSKTSFLK